MNHEFLRDYCMNKKGVTEELPFGNDTLVFKVMGKIFMLTGLEDDSFRINVKCDPETAMELREKYEAVYPGYHMNKKHWNSVEIDGSIPQKEVLKMIDDSYDLVISTMPKKLKEQLKTL